MSGSLRQVLQACGGQTPPHACARRPKDASCGETCPGLTRCLQALHPSAPCALIRFQLKSDGSSSLPFTSQNFRAVQCVASGAVREDTAPLFTIVHPQDFDRVVISMSQAARTLAPWLQEYRILPQEGGQRWLRSCLVPHRGDADQLVGYGLLTDISAEKQSREELVALCDQGAIGVYRATPDGRYLGVNRHFARLCGYDSPEEFMQSAGSIRDHCSIQPEECAALMRLLESHGSVQRYALELRRRDGGTVWISLNVRAVRNAQGRVECCEGYCADISDQVRGELREGRFSEFGQTRFGQTRFSQDPGAAPSLSPPDAEKPAGIASGGLCPVLAYVRTAILWRLRLPELP